ncbi:hypothetical protein [Streptomyces sp. NPDC002328]|uniref:hypothetical protein n=1 Tax=Streptomyces sp. NPDC002328 TaxID=3364642 RepID=UPI00368D047F
MEHTSTTRRAPTPQPPSASPGSRTPPAAGPLPRDRTEPPHWHTCHPALRPGAARTAERLLRTTTAAPATYPLLLHAARVLLHHGAPHRTATWCAKLHPQARTPSWAAAFRTLRSEALLQLGDLAAAGHEAAAAQDATTTRPTPLNLWPTAVHAEILITQGRYEEAATQLDRPPPPAHTWSALPWLRAHGRLHLATHRHRQALRTFTTTARLARRHSTGRLPHLPWRTDIAETLLHYGHTHQARTLLTQELGTSTAGPRHRATALHLLATTHAPHQRLHTLTQALNETRRCHDHVELARIMTTYAHTLHTTNDPTATAFHQRATHLATHCGLPIPTPTLSP